MHISTIVQPRGHGAPSIADNAPMAGTRPVDILTHAGQGALMHASNFMMAHMVTWTYDDVLLACFPVTIIANLDMT